jgi:hypothetical protein
MSQSVTSKGAPETSPRGTDRVRRRAAQDAARTTALKEGASLTSPSTPEKAEAIERNKHQVAKFGASPGGIRKARQTLHRRKAEAEIVALPDTPVARPALIPGEQVSLQMANRLAKADDLSEKDYVREAANAAGVAVLQKLNGQPLRDRHSRSRHIAQHNAKVAAREAAAAQKG